MQIDLEIKKQQFCFSAHFKQPCATTATSEDINTEEVNWCLARYPKGMAYVLHLQRLESKTFSDKGELNLHNTPGFVRMHLLN